MDKKPVLPDSWSGWTITECIGKGSYGSVYKARFFSEQKNEPERVSAIKIIEIPSGEKEEKETAADHPDTAERKAFYESIVDSLLSEIRTMESLKTNPNAVALQDYSIRHDKEWKWTIFLRMELLTPFVEYKITEEINEKEVIKLGIDICNVLKECAEKNIIHRDIKPENIMVDDAGHFKLGDFGIARKLEKTLAELSVKGTFAYMAPEVYHGEAYDTRADQYSLGIVLYRLLNNNRDPFIDANAPMVSFDEREEALKKRMSGEVLPNPVNGSGSLGLIIRKACSYRPENRFETITEMSDALERCLRGESFGISNLVEISESERKEILRRKRKRIRIIIIVLLAACLALAVGTIIHTRTQKTEYEMMFDASRAMEEHIRETGIEKNNAFLEMDISRAETCSSVLNRSDEAASVRALLEQDAAVETEPKDGEFADCEKWDSSLIYMDEGTALGLAVYYNIVRDNVTNTEKVIPVFRYFYYIKEDSWKSVPDLMLTESIRESIYDNYLPEGFMEAYRAQRNWCLYPESFWIGTGAVYQSAIKLETAALWQNEDGSLDVYVLCRNGTDRLGAEYNYWMMFRNDDEEEILKCWGYFDADQVTVEAGEVKGYLVHLEKDEVLTGTAKWPDIGLWSFISGNNSNYM